MRSAATAILSAFLALVVACGGEDDPPGPPELPGLKIRVVDDVTGDPLEGIRLYCVDEKGKQLNATTDAEGRYDFGLLIEGTYRVVATLRDRGYHPNTQAIEVEGPTDVTIRLQTFDGFPVQVEVPEGVAPPRMLQLFYRQPGKQRRVIQIHLTEKGLGRTMRLLPGEYEVEFRASGLQPVVRKITLAHRVPKPILVTMVPK